MNRSDRREGARDLSQVNPLVALRSRASGLWIAKKPGWFVAVGALYGEWVLHAIESALGRLLARCWDLNWKGCEVANGAEIYRNEFNFGVDCLHNPRKWDCLLRIVSSKCGSAFGDSESPDG
jgi:hypothetical protein